jgi:tetratricopeptide (TPR) repeat protein
LKNNSASNIGTSLDVALKHALRLLESQPALAAEQASEIVKGSPNHPLATLVMGAARRLCSDSAGALEILEPLARAHPGWGTAQYELGLALTQSGHGDLALKALRRAVALEPNLTDAWRALADHLRATGDSIGADAADACLIQAATRDPCLRQAAAALVKSDIPVAEALLREHLTIFPSDVAALRMFAEVAARLGRYRDAEHLLARALERAPILSTWIEATLSLHSVRPSRMRATMLNPSINIWRATSAIAPRSPTTLLR